jgi:hypothetical protein
MAAGCRKRKAKLDAVNFNCWNLCNFNTAIRDARTYPQLVGGLAAVHAEGLAAAAQTTTSSSTLSVVFAASCSAEIDRISPLAKPSRCARNCPCGAPAVSL